MKKKLAVLLITAMTVSMISACGTDKAKTEEGQTVEAESSTTEAGTEAAGTESTEPILLKDYDVESVVTLNEYKGMAVSLTKPTVTDAEVDSYITSILSNYGGKEEFAIMDRAVEEGDTVNINYSGKLDGVAFDGGTDDSEKVVIKEGAPIVTIEKAQQVNDGPITNALSEVVKDDIVTYYITVENSGTEIAEEITERNWNVHCIDYT